MLLDAESCTRGLAWPLDKQEKAGQTRVWMSRKRSLALAGEGKKWKRQA